MSREVALGESGSGCAAWSAVALRRSRCDLRRARLQILEAATLVEGEFTWGSPKTHRQRSVSIPRFVCEDLAGHLDDAMAELQGRWDEARVSQMCPNDDSEPETTAVEWPDRSEENPV